MLYRDLAELYGVETKRLKEAVRRNISRFPEDFIFEMDKGLRIRGRNLRPLKRSLRDFAMQGYSCKYPDNTDISVINYPDDKGVAAKRRYYRNQAKESIVNGCVGRVACDEAQHK